MVLLPWLVFGVDGSRSWVVGKAKLVVGRETKTDQKPMTAGLFVFYFHFLMVLPLSPHQIARFIYPRKILANTSRS